MSANNEHVVVFINSLHIHACHSDTLNRLVTNLFYLSLCRIEKPNNSIARPDAEIVFKRSDAYWHCLQCVSVALFWDIVHHLLEHQSSLSLRNLFLLHNQLTVLSHQSLSNSFEGSFILVDDLKHVHSFVCKVGRVPNVVRFLYRVVDVVFRLKTSVK